MSKKIHKLGKLKNPTSFIQINLIKGFKYIDKAGEIVNLYHNKNLAPQFTMGLEGLLIEQPTDQIYQLKVTPKDIWLKFKEMDSLEMIYNHFWVEAKKILDVLEVDKISRVGWRNYYVYEFQQKDDQEKYLSKIMTIDKTQLVVMSLKIITDRDFDAFLRLQPVLRIDESKLPGILFDIDVFQNGEFEIKDILKLLREFKLYLSDENDFLNILNKTFK
jgi:hypothetical protein